jgi:hypothetical protein
MFDSRFDSRIGQAHGASRQAKVYRKARQGCGQARFFTIGSQKAQ